MKSARSGDMQISACSAHIGQGWCAQDCVHLHLDARHMGLGGDDSWTRSVHAPYLVPPQSFEFGLRLRAVGAGEDADAIYRQGWVA